MPEVFSEKRSTDAFYFLSLLKRSYLILRENFSKSFRNFDRHMGEIALLPLTS